APWLPALTEQLRQRFTELAVAERLEPGRVESRSTPRRLVLRADLRERQEDREEKFWGPALKIARDASGRWTGAAEGFARKHGVRADELRQESKEPDGDAYLAHVKKVPGRTAADALPGIVASLLRGLTFPKRMSWDA